MWMFLLSLVLDGGWSCSNCLASTVRVGSDHTPQKRILSLMAMCNPGARGRESPQGVGHELTDVRGTSRKESPKFS